MTKAELDAYLAAKEQEYGLSAGELRALWSQESGGSLDTGLKGQELSKGRGAAVGPFQVVPYYHPEFPVGGSVKDQADYATRFYAQGGDTQEKRLKRYYGTGTPPAGHPTTAQYVSQTMSRMPQQELNMDNSETFQIQDEQMMPASFTPNYIPLPQPRSYNDFPEMQQRPAGKMETWLGDPLTQMGMGMLMASGTDWGVPLGYGMANAAAGLNAQRQMENELYELQMKREESKRKAMQGDRKEVMEALEWNQKQSELANVMALADEYERRGDRVTAMKLRAGIKDAMKTAEYGKSPYVIKKDNQYYSVLTSSDGTQKMIPLEGTPVALDPETQGAVSASKEMGQTGVKVMKEQFDTATNAATGLNAVQDVLHLMDQGVFTGKTDELARNAAGWYAAITGKEIPTLSNTETSRLIVQDIVLPALSNMKGASSDRDVAMLKEYSQGTHMTEQALRAAMNRLAAKYGTEIETYNKTFRDYTSANKAAPVGFRLIEPPKGYFSSQSKPQQSGGFSIRRKE